MTSGAAPRGLRPYLVALLIVYVAKQIVSALLFPPFTGHDEVAHFGSIRVVATEQRAPTLGTDMLPPDLYRYSAYAIEWRDPDRSPLYTAVHPPLYYALMAPIYRALAGRTPEEIQYALRAAAIPFGAAVVLLSAALVAALYPGDPFLGVTVPAVVAFQPQVSYEAAMVNNDALAIAVYSAMLLALVLAVRDGASLRRAAALGLLAGVGLLAKSTTVMSLALIPLALWMGRRARSWRVIAGYVAVAYGFALVLVGPWWWFMTQHYGDPTAFKALAATQPDLTRHDVTFLQLLFSGRFLVDRWSETWGEFGWRLIHVSPALTAGLLAAAALAVGGLVVGATTSGGSSESPPWRTQALVLLATACLFSYLGAVQFGVRFSLTQARYFFPVVNAAALLAMLGLRTLIPAGWRPAAQAGVVAAAIAINVTIYTAYVVPYWYFR